MSIRDEVFPKCAGFRDRRYNKKPRAQKSIMLCVVLLIALALSFGCRPSRQTPQQANIASVVAADMLAYEEYKRSGVNNGIDFLRPLAPSRIPIWRTAAQNGNPEAQYLLACCFNVGLGVETNKDEATKWFRRATDQNQPNAQLAMARRYAQGKCVEKNQPESIRLAIASASAGNPHAQFALGLSYLLGDTVPKNQGEAVKWLLRAAEGGHAPAQERLALCYSDGDGVRKDESEAVKWYRKAADLNYTSSQIMLGHYYSCGDVIQKDSVEALRWYRKAAELGDKQAMTLVGDVYDNGTGAPMNRGEAVTWYRRAAEKNDAVAQLKLGECYAGVGSRYHATDNIPQNYAEALFWYNRAASNSNLAACVQIGKHYEHGWGVTKDPQLALKWYLHAANKNHSDAMYALGIYYLCRDPLYGYAWQQLGSLKSGHKSEAGYYEIVLSPEEMRAAEEWARSWQPGTTEESILTTTALSDPATPVRRMHRAMADGYYDTVRLCVLEDQHHLLRVLEQMQDSFKSIRFIFREYNREVTGDTARISHNTPNGKSYVTVVVRTGDRWKVDFKQTVVENN